MSHPLCTTEGCSLGDCPVCLEFARLHAALRQGAEDTALLDWLDSASVDELQSVFGYATDGNSARWSIDLIRNAASAASQPA